MAATTSHSTDSTTSAPGCVSAEEAFRRLGIDRTTGYRAIKAGTFPLPVIRVGRLIKVPTAALHRLLADSTIGYHRSQESDGDPA